MATTFAVGDRVQWSSQAGGFAAEKTGVVLSVVYPGTPLSAALPHNTEPYAVDALDSRSGVRNHESYIVSVDRGGTRKPALYWPVVSKLKKVEV